MICFQTFVEGRRGYCWLCQVALSSINTLGLFVITTKAEELVIIALLLVDTVVGTGGGQHHVVVINVVIGDPTNLLRLAAGKMSIGNSE